LAPGSASPTCQTGTANAFVAGFEGFISVH